MFGGGGNFGGSASGNPSFPGFSFPARYGRVEPHPGYDGGGHPGFGGGIAGSSAQSGRDCSLSSHEDTCRSVHTDIAPQVYHLL